MNWSLRVPPTGADPAGDTWCLQSARDHNLVEKGSSSVSARCAPASYPAEKYHRLPAPLPRWDETEVFPVPRPELLQASRIPGIAIAEKIVDA